MLPFKYDKGNLSPVKKPGSPRGDCRDLFTGEPRSTTLTPMDGLGRRDLFLEDARKCTQEVMLHGAPLPLAWAFVGDNIIPDYAVPFSEAYGGPQFIARAFLEGQYYIGRAGTGLPFGALVFYGARQLTVKRYEVLCFATEMRWAFGAHGSVQQSSVILSNSALLASSYDSLETQTVTTSLLDSDFMRVIPDNGISSSLPKPPSPLTPLSRRAIDEMCESVTHETKTQTTLIPNPVVSRRHEHGAGLESFNIKATSSTLHEHQCSQTCGCGHRDMGRKRSPSSPLRQYANVGPEMAQIGQRVRRFSANAPSHSGLRGTLAIHGTTLSEQESSTSHYSPSHGRIHSLSALSPSRSASFQYVETVLEDQSDIHRSATVSSPRAASCLSPITHFTIPEPFNEAKDAAPTLHFPVSQAGSAEQITRRSHQESERAAYLNRSTHPKPASTVRVSSPLAGRRPLPFTTALGGGHRRSALHVESTEEDTYVGESDNADNPLIVPLTIAAGANRLRNVTSTQHQYDVQQETVGRTLRPAPPPVIEEVTFGGENYQESRDLLSSGFGVARLSGSHSITRAQSPRTIHVGSSHGRVQSTTPIITPLVVAHAQIERTSESSHGRILSTTPFIAPLVFGQDQIERSSGSSHGRIQSTTPIITPLVVAQDQIERSSESFYGRVQSTTPIITPLVVAQDQIERSSESFYGRVQSTAPIIAPLVVGQHQIERGSGQTTLQIDASSHGRKVPHTHPPSYEAPASPVRSRPIQPLSPWSIGQSVTRVDEKVDDREVSFARHDIHRAVSEVDYTKSQLTIDANVRRQVTSQSSAESSASSTTSRYYARDERSLHTSSPPVPLIIVSPMFNRPNLPESPRERDTTFQYNDYSRRVSDTTSSRKHEHSGVASSIAMAAAATATATAATAVAIGVSDANKAHHVASPRPMRTEDENITRDRHSANRRMTEETSEDLYVSRTQQTTQPLAARTQRERAQAQGHGELTIESTEDRRVEVDVRDIRASDTQGWIRPASPAGRHIGVSTRDSYVNEIEKKIDQSSYTDTIRVDQRSGGRNISDYAEVPPPYAVVGGPSVSSFPSSSDDEFEDVGKVSTSAHLDVTRRVSGSSSDSWVDIQEKQHITPMPAQPTLSDRPRREDVESNVQGSRKFVETVDVSESTSARYSREDHYSSRTNDTDDRLQRRDADEYHPEELHVNPVWDAAPQPSGPSSSRQRYQVPVSKYLRSEDNKTDIQSVTTRENVNEQTRAEQVPTSAYDRTSGQTSESKVDVEKVNADKGRSRASSPKHGSSLVSTLLAGAAVASIVYEAISESRHKKEPSVRMAVEEDKHDTLTRDHGSAVVNESVSVTRDSRDSTVVKERDVVEHSQRRVDSIDCTDSSTRTSTEVVRAEDTKVELSARSVDARTSQVETGDCHHDTDREHGISVVGVETRNSTSQSTSNSSVSERACVIDASITERSVSSIRTNQTGAKSECSELTECNGETPQGSTDATCTAQISSERACDIPSMGGSSESSTCESVSQCLVVNEGRSSEIQNTRSQQRDVGHSLPEVTPTLRDDKTVRESLEVSSSGQQMQTVTTTHETVISTSETEQSSRTDIAFEVSRPTDSPPSKRQNSGSQYLGSGSTHIDNRSSSSRSWSLDFPPRSPLNPVTDSPAPPFAQPTPNISPPANGTVPPPGRSASSPVTNIENHTAIINNTQVSIHNEQTVVLLAGTQCDAVNSTPQTDCQNEHPNDHVEGERAPVTLQPRAQSLENVNLTSTRAASSVNETRLTSVSESSEISAECRGLVHSGDATTRDHQATAMSDIRDHVVAAVAVAAAATTVAVVGAVLTEEKTTSQSQSEESSRCQTQTSSDVHKPTTKICEGMVSSDHETEADRLGCASADGQQSLRLETQEEEAVVHDLPRPAGVSGPDYSDAGLSTSTTVSTSSNTVYLTQSQSSEVHVIENTSAVRTTESCSESETTERRVVTMEDIKESSNQRTSVESFDRVSEVQSFDEASTQSREMSSTSVQHCEQTNQVQARTDSGITRSTSVFQEEHITDVESRGASLCTEHTSALVSTAIDNTACSLAEAKFSDSSNDGSWVTGTINAEATSRRSSRSSSCSSVSSDSIHTEMLYEDVGNLGSSKGIITRSSRTPSLELPNPFDSDHLMTDVQQCIQSPTELTPNSSHEQLQRNEHSNMHDGVSIESDMHVERFSIEASTTHTGAALVQASPPGSAPCIWVENKRGSDHTRVAVEVDCSSERCTDEPDYNERMLRSPVSPHHDEAPSISHHGVETRDIQSSSSTKWVSEFRAQTGEVHAPSNDGVAAPAACQNVTVHRARVSPNTTETLVISTTTLTELETSGSQKDRELRYDQCTSPLDQTDTKHNTSRSLLVDSRECSSQRLVITANLATTHVLDTDQRGHQEATREFSEKEGYAQQPTFAPVQPSLEHEETHDYLISDTTTVLNRSSRSVSYSEEASTQAVLSSAFLSDCSEPQDTPPPYPGVNDDLTIETGTVVEQGKSIQKTSVFSELTEKQSSTETVHVKRDDVGNDMLHPSSLSPLVSNPISTRASGSMVCASERAARDTDGNATLNSDTVPSGSDSVTIYGVTTVASSQENEEQERIVRIQHTSETSENHEQLMTPTTLDHKERIQNDNNSSTSPPMQSNDELAEHLEMGGGHQGESETTAALSRNFAAWDRYYRDNTIEDNSTFPVEHTSETLTLPESTCDDGVHSGSRTPSSAVSSEMAVFPQTTGSALTPVTPVFTSATFSVQQSAINKSDHSSREVLTNFKFGASSTKGCLDPEAIPQGNTDKTSVVNTCGELTERQLSDSVDDGGDNSYEQRLAVTSSSHMQAEGHRKVEATAITCIEADLKESRLVCRVDVNRDENSENTAHHVPAADVESTVEAHKTETTDELTGETETQSLEKLTVAASLISTAEERWECNELHHSTYMTSSQEKEALSSANDSDQEPPLRSRASFDSISLRVDGSSHSLMAHDVQSKDESCSETAIRQDLVTIQSTTTPSFTSSASDELTRDGIITQESSRFDVRRRASDSDFWQLVTATPCTHSVHAKDEADAPGSANELSTASSRSPVSPPDQTADSEPLIRHQSDTCHSLVSSNSIPTAFAALSHDESFKQGEHMIPHEYQSARLDVQFSSNIEQSIRTSRKIHEATTYRRSSSVVPSTYRQQRSILMGPSLRAQKKATSLPGTPVEWASLPPWGNGQVRFDQFAWNRPSPAPKPLDEDAAAHESAAIVKQEIETGEELSVTNMHWATSRISTQDFAGHTVLVDTKSSSDVMAPFNTGDQCNDSKLTAETLVGASKLSVTRTRPLSKPAGSADAWDDAEYRALITLFESLESKIQVDDLVVTPQKDLEIVVGAPNTPPGNSPLLSRSPTHEDTSDTTNSISNDNLISVARSEAIDHSGQTKLGSRITDSDTHAVSVAITSVTTQLTDSTISVAHLVSPESTTNGSIPASHEKAAGEVTAPSMLSGHLIPSPVLSAPGNDECDSEVSSSVEEDECYAEQQTEHSRTMSQSLISTSIETKIEFSTQHVSEVVSSSSALVSSEGNAMPLNSISINTLVSTRPTGVVEEGSSSDVPSHDHPRFGDDGDDILANLEEGMRAITGNEQCSEVTAGNMVAEAPSTNPYTPPEESEPAQSRVNQDKSGGEQLKLAVDDCHETLEPVIPTTVQQASDNHEHFVEREQELHSEIASPVLGEIKGLKNRRESISLVGTTTESPSAMQSPSGLGTMVTNGPMIISLLRHDTQIKLDIKPADPDLALAELSLVRDEDGSSCQWAPQLIDYQRHILQPLPHDTEYSPIVVLIIDLRSSVEQVVCSANDQISHIGPRIGEEFLLLCVVPSKDEESMTALGQIVLGIEHRLNNDGIGIDALPVEELELGYLISVVVQEPGHVEEQGNEGEEEVGEETGVADEAEVEHAVIDASGEAVGEDHTAAEVDSLDEGAREEHKDNLI